MSKIPEGLKYTKEHEWVRFEGDLAIIGVTDHAQGELGDIVFLEFPKPGKKVQQMKAMGTIESVKAASDLFCPLSGEVVEVNQGLTEAPEKVNQDPYGEGWMVKIRPSNRAEGDALLDAQAYAALAKEKA